MAESERRDRAKSAPIISKMELVNKARQFVHEVNTLAGKPSTLVLLTVEPSQSEVCAALFDVAAATQTALVANNCAGV